METLFRATRSRRRFSLNMNVLTADHTPVVMGLRGVLQAWLDHRHEVLERRSRHRLAAIRRRIEVLDGYLAVFLNLDEVIRIIREEDQPKPALIARFDADRCAGRGDPEHAPALAAAARGDGNPQGAQGADPRGEGDRRAAEGRPAALGEDRGRSSRMCARGSAVGRSGTGGRGWRMRRRRSRSMPSTLIEREPITVILSQKGWIRAVARPSGGRRRAEVQGGRRAAAAGAVPDDGPAVPHRDRRAGAYAAGRRLAARPGRRAADPARGGDGQRRGGRGAVRLAGGAASI